MITVVLQEKGGEEQRLNFDKDEITIGRVPTNDIVLAKGNISKRHARLVVKDSRIVVVDLKSTNGTFVNGRKVVSPLVIQGEDRVFVGDYVLRVEGEGIDASSAHGHSMPPALPTADAGQGEEESVNFDPPNLQSQPLAADNGPPVAATMTSRPVMERIEVGMGHGVGQPQPTPSVPLSLTNRNLIEHSRTVDSMSPQAQFMTSPGPQAGDAVADTPQLALQYIMQRVQQSFNVFHPQAPSAARSARHNHARELIEQVLRSLEQEGFVASNLDRGALREMALREAVFFGALTSWIDDSAVQALSVDGPAHISICTNRGWEETDAFFSSLDSLRTAVKRLFSRAGSAYHSTLPYQGCRLDQDWTLSVVGQPVALHGLYLEIRRSLTLPNAFDLLKHKNVIQDAGIAVLQDALRAGKNIFVCGTHSHGVRSILNVLASEMDTETQIVCVESAPHLRLDGHPYVSRLALEDSWYEVAARLASAKQSQVIVDAQGSCNAFETIRCAIALRSNVCVALRAQSAQELLKFLGLSALAQGVAADAVSTLVGEAVHTIVHVASGSDEQNFRVSTITEVRIGEKGLQTRDSYSDA